MSYLRNRKRRSVINAYNGKVFLGVFAIIFVIIVIAVSSSSYYNNIQTFSVKVTDKERIQPREGSGYYLVYTSQGTFGISKWFGQDGFRSSDTYGRIEIGKEYQFKTYGFRNGWLSWYPMIYEVHPK